VGMSHGLRAQADGEAVVVEVRDVVLCLQ